jgi:acyl-CoA reductase-like NAD-dependent aldehyde dehydrogenase
LINALRSSNASPKLTTINPATEQVLNEYEINTKDQLNYSVNKARQAFLDGRTILTGEQIFFMRLPRSFEKIKKVLQEPARKKWGRQ